MIIEQPAAYLRWLYPKALWRMDRRERSVYLTFDDGPIPESTPFILETLRRYNVKATFFMVGDNVRKYPDLFEQIKADGHQVGNHTHNHIGALNRTIHEYNKLRVVTNWCWSRARADSACRSRRMSSQSISPRAKAGRSYW